MARTPKTTVQEQKTTPPASIFGVPAEDLSTEQLDELLSEEDFDIFTDLGEPLVKSGDRITYTLKRDGEFLVGSIKHPCSWDEIQRKYGGGTYQVTARSLKKGGYIKSQSRNVAPPFETPEEHKNIAPQGTSTTDLMLLLQNMKKEEREESLAREDRLRIEKREEQERKDQEAKERIEEMKNSSNTTMTMMMQMMKSQSDQTTALLAGLMGGKKEEVNIEKIVTMMDQRMEKMLDRLTGKKNNGEPSVAEQIKMAADAEERGVKKTMEMMRLSEKRAEELADLRERGGGSKEDGPSTIAQVMEAVMPMVQTFAAGKLGVAQAAHAAPGAVNPHQKALPPPPGPLTGRRSPNAAQLLGLNRVPGERKATVMNVKQLIETTVVTEIGKDLSSNMLTGKFNPEGSAEKALSLLTQHKITPSSLCSQYSLDDMLSGAKARGLPDSIKPYLERFYAHIKGKIDAGTKDEAPVVTGSAPESSQPTNS